MSARHRAPAPDHGSDEELDAVEVTTFRLQHCTPAEFFAANAEVDDWLSRQPGFCSRRIAERPDGEIVDVLVWRSVLAGEEGAARLMRELAGSPVHAMIDPASVSWSVLPVRRRRLA